jgi:hypothetical protein
MAVILMLTTARATAQAKSSDDDATAVASNVVVPAAIEFQGSVADRIGNPLPDGTYKIRFAFYDKANGGNQIWEEIQTVELKDGNFVATLGTRTPLNLTFDTSRWLAVAVDGADADTTRIEFLIPTASADAR